MARGKKSRKTGLPIQAQTDTQGFDTHSPIYESNEDGSNFFERRFSLFDYAIVCAFFIAFCFLQEFVALKWFGVDSSDPSLEALSLKFFFGTMWKGFILVALLALLHDFFYQDSDEEDTA